MQRHGRAVERREGTRKRKAECSASPIASDITIGCHRRKW
jgi:hypothetical protein